MPLRGPVPGKRRQVYRTPGAKAPRSVPRIGRRRAARGGGLAHLSLRSRLRRADNHPTARSDRAGPEAGSCRRVAPQFCTCETVESIGSPPRSQSLSYGPGTRHDCPLQWVRRGANDARPSSRPAASSHDLRRAAPAPSTHRAPPGIRCHEASLFHRHRRVADVFRRGRPGPADQSETRRSPKVGARCCRSRARCRRCRTPHRRRASRHSRRVTSMPQRAPS